MVQQISTNTFGVSKWVVSPDATQGTHTTLTAAMVSASSGDTIYMRDGTYTENVTLKAGVNITALIATAYSGTVTIVGKLSYSGSGIVSLSGIRIQTNGDYAIEITGVSASQIYMENCYLNLTNNAGIHFTSSNSSSVLNLVNVEYDQNRTYPLFICNTSGALVLVQVSSNNGAIATPSTFTGSGLLDIYDTTIGEALTTSGTSSFACKNTLFQSGVDANAFTFAGTGGIQNAVHSNFIGQVVITNALEIIQCTVSSAQTNAITGIGIATLGDVTFASTGSGVNTSTINKLSTFPGSTVNVQTFTSSGTYTPSRGMMYCIIECVGGGGGGGGSASAAANVYATGGGGGGGASSRKLASAAIIGASKVVTVGAAGIAGTAGNNAGGSGGATSVTTICTANGGTGGSGNAGTNGAIATGGAGGTAGTGDFSVPGQQGFNAFNGQTYPDPQGGGGSSLFGFGGTAPVYTGASSNPGQVYGGGGSGGFNISAGGDTAGAAGAAGIVIITEYIS